MTNFNDEVESAIKWFAAEYEYLEELHRDLVAIEQEKDTDKKQKEIKKALRVAAYIGNAERKAERKLHHVKDWLSKLAKEKKQKVSDVIMELEIPEKKLIAGSSRRVGTLRNGLNHFLELAKKEKKHPEIQALHEQFEKEDRNLISEVENLEKWLQALELGLKRISRRGFLKKAGAAAVVGAGVAGGINFDRLDQVLTRLSRTGATIGDDFVEKLLHEISVTLPHVDPRFDKKRYAKAINQSLDKTRLSNKDRIRFLYLIISITSHETGFRNIPRKAIALPFFSESSNDDTTGPMEVKVANYAHKKKISMEKARALLQTIKVGMEAGIEQLYQIMTNYGIKKIDTNNVNFILADWYAGEFSCRNAAVQARVKALGENIAVDGDLLFYAVNPKYVNEKTRSSVETGETGRVTVEYGSDGKAYVRGHVGDKNYFVDVPFSETEKAIAKVLKMDQQKVRKDLVLSNTIKLTSTNVYKSLMSGTSQLLTLPYDARLAGGRIRKFVAGLLGESTSVHGYIKTVKEYYVIVTERGNEILASSSK